MKDYLNYSGKVCVVTGAASGMGKATAERLVDLGAEVYALDLNESDTAGIKKFIKVNLGEKESIDRAFQEIPEHIDSFFGIAGISGLKASFVVTATVNFVSNVYMTENYIVPRMSAGGSICYMTSNAGLYWDIFADEIKDIAVAEPSWEALVAKVEAADAELELPGNLGYVFSKRCVNYYVITKVTPLAAKGIRINAVLPCGTNTGLAGDFAAMQGSMENFAKNTGAAGRLAEPHHMAEPIIFMNSPMADYMSGTLLDVDYGMHNMGLIGLYNDQGKTALSDISKLIKAKKAAAQK